MDILDKNTFIDRSKNGEISLLETYFGYDYDKIVRNKNFLSRLLLGPLYVAVKGFMIQGFLLSGLDLFLFNVCFLVNINFPITGFGLILNFLLVLFNRVLWMSLDNIIYLSLLSKKLEKIKDYNPTNYRDLIDLEQRKNSDLLNLLGIVYLISIILIIIFLTYTSK